MANLWLAKTEPSEYSFDTLLEDKKTVWDGVSNNLALIHLRAMKKGDLVLMYHTGAEKVIAGIAEVVSEPYPDPTLRDLKRVVVELSPKKKLTKPVPLAKIKADKRFTQFELIRNGRLSVMPVSKTTWDALLEMAK